MKKKIEKLMNEVKLEWYVLNSTWGCTKNEFNEYPYTFYETDIRPYNVFNNYYVMVETLESTVKFIKKGSNDFDKLKDELMKILQWQEWSRAEYEIQVVEWPSRTIRDTNEVASDKIDCYTQVLPNADVYTKYVYYTIKEAMHKRKKTKKDE